MIVVIPCVIEDESGNEHFVASHGVDPDTLRNIVLPAEHPEELGARFDKRMGEWVIYGI